MNSLSEFGRSSMPDAARFPPVASVSFTASPQLRRPPSRPRIRHARRRTPRPSCRYTAHRRRQGTAASPRRRIAVHAQRHAPPAARATPAAHRPRPTPLPTATANGALHTRKRPCSLRFSTVALPGSSWSTLLRHCTTVAASSWRRDGPAPTPRRSSRITRRKPLDDTEDDEDEDDDEDDFRSLPEKARERRPHPPSTLS